MEKLMTDFRATFWCSAVTGSCVRWPGGMFRSTHFNGSVSRPGNAVVRLGNRVMPVKQKEE
jgi:hypothetical protein